MKRTIALFMVIIFIIPALVSLAFASVSNALSPDMSNFKNIKTYTANTFTDVFQSLWYYPEIANAYSFGIVEGKGNNLFDPGGNMRISEAIAVSTRIHSIYNGGNGIITPSIPDIWYSGNIDYAENNGILEENEFEDQYERFATRAELVRIYSRALLPEEFQAINNIDSIPDVSVDTPYYSDIMAMYEAGVVIGNDAQGTFRPESNTTRAEATTILNRIIDPDKRKTFTPVSPIAGNAFEIFMETGDYAMGTGEVYGEGDCMFYKSAYPDLSDNGIRENLTWYVFIDPNGGPTYDSANYECEIILRDWNFDLTTRHQVRDALKIIYPAGYDQVYDCMIKALNFELWEAGVMNTRNATSGTMWTRYFDGRAINLQFQYDIGAFRVYFYKNGYTQPPPEQESEQATNAKIIIAKDFAGWKILYESCQLDVY
jgi:hypothetical protein